MQCHGLFVEVDAGEQRLSAVPAEGDGGHLYGLDVLADVPFQEFARHLGLVSSVEVGFAQVVAVFAVEVTQRAHGLYHGGEGRGSCQLLRVGEVQCVVVHLSCRGISGLLPSGLLAGAPCCMPRRSSRW